MKYVHEYRNKELSQKLINKIHHSAKGKYTFMEVCGGHTMAIQKFGIPSLLPPKIKLLSGPGCPVCVTEKSYIDTAIAYARLSNTIIATFGDLMRIPGSTSSLELEKARGSDVTIVLSALEALKIAQNKPDKKIIFLAIGFETTAPGSAVAVVQASKARVKNFFILSAHKLMPPAMKAIVDEGVKIDGYICPGHVSTITGSAIYDDIARKYSLPCVISGFEPLDLLQTILALVHQVNEKHSTVEIQYARAVQPNGNPKAKAIMKQIFCETDSEWRGMGNIPKSKLVLSEKYQQYDAEKMIPVDVEPTISDKGCICGEILKGLKTPLDCKLFGSGCTPENPEGACMVSGEGACQAYYRYQSQTEIT
ncbi:Hydrogenase isoenzymes formation protein HypD [Salinivirga cyanobacteriivorans]|uniref:Hydrogenase isoenzymes formation protein HypD n=1 Tax=Salinivirga cyanobacteriivorans TaxID=1307839 RepID=A0A0S2HXT7_9BACT|nr:hydrogenase formation protein HypD [Salinivirga cyanobacteriivorans]ALO14921.1 Hydrogenase isoenzymes formation protein HypD [Salinivirga cyanobacteriivorans]